MDPEHGSGPACEIDTLQFKIKHIYVGKCGRKFSEVKIHLDFQFSICDVCKKLTEYKGQKGFQIRKDPNQKFRAVPVLSLDI